MVYEKNEYKQFSERPEFVLPGYNHGVDYNLHLAKKFGPQEKPGAGEGLTALGSMLVDMKELELVNI